MHGCFFGQKVKIKLLLKGVLKALLPRGSVPLNHLAFLEELCPLTGFCSAEKSTCMSLLRWIWSWHGKGSCFGLNHTHGRRATLNMHQKESLSVKSLLGDKSQNSGESTVAEFSLPFKFWNSRSSFFLSSTCSNSCFCSSSKKQTEIEDVGGGKVQQAFVSSSF